MLEGTRNERAAVVSASYVIGFVTAFIAFGINQLNPLDAVATNVTQTAQTATAINAVANKPTLKESQDGLVLITKDGTEILLSARQTPANAASALDDGLYASLPHYELSPDNNYVYFCETPVAELTDCKPFVYSLATDTVVPLVSQGQRIAVANNEQKLTWSSNGVATIGELTLDPQF